MNMDQPSRNINLPVEAVLNSEPLTMNSREIAELVDSRHDKVKQSIERLVARRVIVQPPMGDEQDTDTMGRQRTTSVYHMQKRDSFVVVAQLSPEFTARLVDRWQQLEEEKANVRFAIPRTLGEALQLAADQAKQIDAMKEDVAAHERLSKAQGSLNITEAAKNLGMRPGELFDWLSHHGWIYKRPRSQNWLGYAPRCNSGDLWHKSTTVLRADGSEKISEQVRITPQGLSKLAKLIFPTVKLIGGAA